MRRMLIMILFVSLLGPVKYSNGNNEETIDKEFVITSLKYYESLIKNYSVSYTQTLNDDNPRFQKILKEMFGAEKMEESDKFVKYKSTNIIFENGNWWAEGYSVLRDGEKVGGYIESSNASQRMLYKANKERGDQAVPVGLIEKPGVMGSNNPRPCDILFINQKGIAFSSIVDDPNTKVYSIKHENQDMIVCEYTDELLNKVYLDPDSSFAVVKHELYKLDNGRLWSALENIKYIDAGDGIKFPVYADEILYMVDEKGLFPAQINTLEVDEKSLKLNQELSKNVFTIDFPKGTVIRDDIIGLQYRVDDNKLLDGLIDEVAQNQIDQSGNAISESSIESNDPEENDQAVISNDKIETNIVVPEAVENISADTSKRPLIIYVLFFVVIIFAGVAYLKHGVNRK